MNFRDLMMKKSYDSDSDDILRDFYIPALSCSTLYKRLTGFFSSTSLAVAAKGVCELISNGGKIELVCGAKFTESDIEAIKEVYTSPESVLEELILDELNNLVDKFVEDHVRAFGWMLKNQLLTIKIAIVCDKMGIPLDYRSIEQRGLFHQKVGILEDLEGNRLSFSGSENESAAGWQSNIEEFKVFRNWVSTEEEYFEADLRKFEKYWNGYPDRTKVIDLPEAAKNKLIKSAPDNLEDLKIDRWYTKKPKMKRPIALRDYQKDAVSNWLSKGKKGIFEMATGTGKTFAALGCLRVLLNKEDSLITIIACPYNHLITQWSKNIQEFGIALNAVVADSTRPSWRDKLVDKIIDVDTGVDKHLIVLTTHDSLPSKDFREIMQKMTTPIFLVADEVHGIGTPERKRGLLGEYKYRLGLSATPRRWFDPEGTQALFQYFGPTVYEFPLNKAIGRFLIEYEYHPHFVSLTSEELEEYENQTRKVAKAYYSAKNDPEREEWFTLLCIRRQDIVKNAHNKYRVLQKIVDQCNELKHCLVYCVPEQLESVQDILLERNIIQHRFTQSEGTRPEDKYGGISERDYLLEQFSKGTIQVLVAMKCLDEGIDVPQARLAIMMANSGNPREYIQRRGRVLRKYPGKKVSVIHDIIVTPFPKLLKDPQLAKLERKIFLRELRRYREFSSIAKNAVDCLRRIEELEEKYEAYEL